MRLSIALLISEPRYRKLAWRAAFLLYGALLVIGSIPGARADIGELASGFSLHMSAYAILTLLLFCGVRGSAWGRACKSVLMIAVMGALDECVQSFFPYRSADVMDWFVDMNAGLLISAMLWAAWPKGASGKQSEPVA